jgi:hypothetical protein
MTATMIETGREESRARAALAGPAPTRIERYRFGSVVVDGREYTEDILVFPDRPPARWWRTEGHLLRLEDVEEALVSLPEVLIIGSGSHECLQIAPEVWSRTRELGVELLVFDTRTACRTFNEVLPRRRAVAVLHLTC